MSDEALFVDTEELFAVAAELRSTAAAPAAAPALEPPDVGHAGLADVLWRMSFLARGIPGAVDVQVGYIGDALMQGAIDTDAADVAPVVETATGTTAPPTSTPATTDPPSPTPTAADVATADVATATTTPPASPPTTVAGQD